MILTHIAPRALFTIPSGIRSPIQVFDDLDSATAPVLKRSVTILRRGDYFDDCSLFNTPTRAEVLS